MVPDSAKFIQWLNTTPNPLHPGMLVPTQMIHRRSEIDEHMLTYEEAIQQQDEWRIPLIQKVGQSLHV
jgi:hypothetical protein